MVCYNYHLLPKLGRYDKLTIKEAKEITNRKCYGKSFKEEAVRLANETIVRKAAKSLGNSEYTLRNWVTNARHRQDNPFIGSVQKYISAEDAEKAALLKENRELKRANKILKEALVFFAKSQKK